MPTAYLERGRLLWLDFIGRVLSLSRRERIELSYPHRLALPLAFREQAEKRLLWLVKPMSGSISSDFAST